MIYKMFNLTSQYCSIFHGCIMVVTWFSDGQRSYNTMVGIDTNHGSTLFTVAIICLWTIATISQKKSNQETQLIPCYKHCFCLHFVFPFKKRQQKMGTVIKCLWLIIRWAAVRKAWFTRFITIKHHEKCSRQL